MAQSADSTCLCEICIGGPGDYYCQQCDQFFCRNCKLSHLRAKISKKHMFFSGENINKEEKRLCIEHEERFLFYCHKCDTPVCSSCSVHTHRGHFMTDLTKSAVKLKLELVKIIESTITTSTSCIGKIEEDTKTYHQKTKTVNKTITEEGNYYKELIDKKVHSFVKLVQDETQKALGSMSTATKVYLEILENCQQWQKNITEMETKSDVLLVKKLKHLKTDVDQTVLKQSLDTPRPSVSYTNKKLSDTDIDNLFGELTFHRNTDERPDCKSEEKHMKRYKEERNKLKDDSLAGERNVLEQKLQKIEDENAKLQEKNKNLETHLAGERNVLEQKLQKIEDENAKLQEKNKNLETHLARERNVLEQKLQKIEDENAKLQEKNKNLETHLAGERNVLEQKLQKIEDENAKLQEKNKNLETHLARERNVLEQKLQKIEDENAKLKEKNKNLETHLAGERNVLEQKLQKIEDENAKLQEKKNNLETHLARERNVLEQKLQKIEDENAKLQEKNKNLETHLAGERNVLEQKLQKIEDENAKLQEKNKDLETQKIDACPDCKMKEQHMQRYKAERNELKVDRQRLEKLLANLAGERNDLAQNLQKKEFENTKLVERNQSLETQSRSAKRHVFGQEDKEFTNFNMWKTNTLPLPERYSAGGGRLDTEKENISLRNELTEAGENIEKIRREYSDLSEKYETGIIATKRTIESLQREKDCLEQEKHDFRAKLDQLQSDLNHYKNEQVHEQDSSHGKIDNLLQQNRKLDNDRELLRGKIFSLENEKIKLDDLFNKSKEDRKELQRDQDKLQDNLREKSNELKDSEARIRKLEADILFLQNTKTENDQLKESLLEIEGVKREFEIVEKRYQKETSDRMSSDNISTKLKEDNDRLRKERNDARTELQRVLKEKKESLYQNLNTEKNLAREDLQTKEREKLELVALFKNKEEKDLQKLKIFEKDIETLKSKCRDDNEKMRQSEHEIEILKSRLKDDNDKIQRFEHEIYTLKSSCRDDNDQVQRMERENETLKSRCKEDNEKMRQSEHEIESLKSRLKDDNDIIQHLEHEIYTLKSLENLKSRLTGEKANQYSAYEMLQNKNDLETCKYQKKALEDERNELQKENIELQNELQYQKETSDRMSSDNISTKLKEDNDRLRKERNDARTELQRVLKEKKESLYQNLNTEKNLAREDLQTKEREKLELVALFKNKEEKDLQKLKIFEKDIETLKSKCRDDNEKMRQSEHEIEILKSRLKDDNDKIQRFEHEIYTLKSSCRDDNDQVQRMKRENETLKSRCKEDNEKMRQSEHEIESLKSRLKDDNDIIQHLEHEIYTLKSLENLKSRLTGEKANQYSAYEMLQNKNDLETCKYQKKALEDERNELQKENIELQNELQYQKETSDRMSSDNISTKLKEDNDRLRKERNDARTELQRVLKEKKESLYQNLNTEKNLAREDLQTKEREKLELVALFKNKEEKDLQKLKIFEKDIETLKSKCRDDNEKMRQSEHEIEILKSRLKDDNDKIQRFEHEIYTLKSSCRDDNDQVQRMKRENETLKSRCKEDNEKMRQSEHEIESLKSRLKDDNDIIQHLEHEIYTLKSLENLKSRLTGEKANQYSAYEMLQNKNDLETCKYQKKALEDERNELQKENIELQNELQSLNSKLEQFEDSVRNISNLKKEIKDHEEGYRNITSKLHEAERQMGEQNETLEDQKQENREIYKEKKDLENKLRLALNNEEQASLGKECEELKTILQEKQEELYNLKSRFQKLTDSKETSEVLNKIIESLKQENSDLNQRLRELEVLKRQVQKLDFENSELKRRLSEAAGNKLRDNTPNIADLSDMNRPTSLAEKFSSLYTDEYTDAMKVIEDDMNEAASVKVMLDWLKSCYAWCQRLAKEQRETLINRSIGFMEDHGGHKVVLSDRCLIFVKEFQKKIAAESLAVVGQICHAKSVTQQTLSRENFIVKYIKKCSELCWMMQISDPPLFLNFDVNSGENLNKNDYIVFTKSGSKIDYLVWPVLYLHKTGPMLAKGVAQGK